MSRAAYCLHSALAACRRRAVLLPTLAACLHLAAAIPASACNVPVFRFALENWDPHPYRLVLFHHGPLSPAEKQVADKLQDYLLDAGCPANCIFDRVELSSNGDAEMANLWNEQKDATLPWLVLRYPKIAKTPRFAYAGPLDGGKVKALFDSPVRAELAKRLLQGTSAVWLFLESGDKTKDDAKAAWLQAYLNKLETELSLPELTKEPKDRLRVSDLKLKIDFSIIRMSRSDPAEAVLTSMLLGTEEDLDEVREPMAFSVIGRGRVVHAFLGRGINEKTIAQEAKYILGPCSCEVKEQNPGVDLLMATDWEGGLSKHAAPPPAPPLTGLGETVSPEVADTVDTVAADSRVAPENNGHLWRNVAIGFGGLVLLVALGSLLVQYWKR